MIGRLPRPRRNPNHGRQPRAAWWVRWPRRLARKRVAIAQTGLRQAVQRVEREVARLAHIAYKYKVPMDAMADLPPIPELPTDQWVNFLQATGPLKDPVKAAPAVSAQPTEVSA